MSRFATVTLLVIAIVTYICRVTATCVNGPQDRQCWGEFDINTDYNKVVPDTGTTVEVNQPLFIWHVQYFLTVDNVTMAPDGVERIMLVYNNTFPGPTLTANWGDWIVVHVTNNLQNNGLKYFKSWLITALQYIGMDWFKWTMEQTMAYLALLNV